MVNPAIKDDYTVTLGLFSDGGCCTSVQTMSMGVLDSCHNANQSFQGFSQSVGQTMFGRNIKLLTYAGSDCTNGTFNTYDLSNYGSCFSSDNPWDSFKIASVAPTTTTSTQTTATPTCSSTPPAIKDDNTVIIGLYSDADCCNAVETISLGVLDTCHIAT